MTKWEYKAIRYLEEIYGDRPKGVKWSDHIEEALNALGKDGWQLVGFESTWIFKRPVQDQRAWLE